MLTVMARGSSPRMSRPARSRAVARVRADLVAPARAHTGPAQLIVLIGLPGAGKSHVARQLHAAHGAWHVNADRARRLLGLAPDDHSVHAITAVVAAELLEAGQRVCLDANAATRRVQEDLAALAARCGAHVTLVHVDAPRHVRATRMAARRAGRGREDEVDVPDEVIDRMEAALHVPAHARRIDGAAPLPALAGLCDLHPRA